MIWSGLKRHPRSDLMRARHRLSKLLLRHRIVYSSGRAWTAAHEAWLLKQHFDVASTQAAIEDAYETVALAGARRNRLDEEITVIAVDGEFTPVVHRLACLRGISTLTACALAVEVGGDWHRSTTPKSSPSKATATDSRPRPRPRLNRRHRGLMTTMGSTSTRGGFEPGSQHQGQDEDPVDVAVSPDGSRVYVSHDYAGSLLVIDTR